MQDNYNYYLPKAADKENAYAFADAAYNGGIGGLDKEIKACYLTKECDHKKWWGNVENFCMKSKVALYGNRSACDINRHHVSDVIKTRSPKYQVFFK
jgi:hypothetical protein